MKTYVSSLLIILPVLCTKNCVSFSSYDGMKTLPNTGTLESESCCLETSCRSGLRGTEWSYTKPSGKFCVWDGAIPCTSTVWGLFGWEQLCKKWLDGPGGFKFIWTGQVHFVKEGEQPHHGLQDLSRRSSAFFPLFNVFETALGEQCPCLAVLVQWTLIHWSESSEGWTGTGSAVVTGSAWSRDLDPVTPNLHESAVLSRRVGAFHVTCVKTLKWDFLCHRTMASFSLAVFLRLFSQSFRGSGNPMHLFTSALLCRPEDLLQHEWCAAFHFWAKDQICMKMWMHIFWVVKKM